MTPSPAPELGLFQMPFAPRSMHLILALASDRLAAGSSGRASQFLPFPRGGIVDSMVAVRVLCGSCLDPWICIPGEETLSTYSCCEMADDDADPLDWELEQLQKLKRLAEAYGWGEDHPQY